MSSKLKGEEKERGLHGTDERTRAKKSLGQNFLIDPNVARKIVGRLDLQPADKVLEIGPGKGALSKFLLQSGAQVAGVEKDLALARELKKKWPDMDIIAADASGIQWDRLHRAGFGKIIGNLPYNIASPLIWDIVTRFSRARGMVFTIQKEVGVRLTARPGRKEYGALTVWVQSFAQPRLEFILGPHVFRPRPKVDSAVVSLYPKAFVPNHEQRSALAALLRVCFQQRRKQLKTSLRSLWSESVQDWFTEHGVRPQARPEDITPGEFLSLSQKVFPLQSQRDE
ncbi:MAG: 16S rRNA (adenine(1518)-N(6)/adenine(1519)-N(6))-dimethyltransferase RsmA [Desulfovermiculus sp.]